MYGVRECSNFILWHVAVFPAPSIEEPVFSPLYIFMWPLAWICLWAFYPIPLIYTQENINLCFIDAFNSVDHNKLWKILKEMEYQTTLPASWKTCMWVKKQQLEPDMEQLTGSKLGKEYDKAVHGHLAYAECNTEMLGWMNQKLESRLLGAISTTSDMQIIWP